MAHSSSLSDLLGRIQRIQIFSGLVNDVDSVYKYLSDESHAATVLAPENGAMHRLPNKPWHKKDDYSALGSEAYEGDSGQIRAQSNLQNFVEEHIVKDGSWAEGVKAKTMGGSTLWYEKQGDKLVIKPNDVEVVERVDKGVNGEIWVIKDALLSK